MIGFVVFVAVELALFAPWARREFFARRATAVAAAAPPRERVVFDATELAFAFAAAPACSYSDEYPVAEGWDRQSILTTLAEIASL